MDIPGKSPLLGHAACCMGGSGERCHPGAHGEVGDVITFAFTPLCSLCALADSCEGRCDEGFNAMKKCQCDTLCNYYQSCCSDYSTVCKAKGTGPAATHVLCHRPRWPGGSQ